MDSRDLQEIHKILWWREETLHGNNITLKSIYISVHDNEQHCASQNANFMNLLVQQRQKMDVLEAECGML
jgi:hypothetical protein